MDRDAQQLELVAVVAQGFGELLLARDAHGHVELAADAVGLLIEGHLMAPPGRGHGKGQTGRTGPHHRQPPRPGRQFQGIVDFMPGPGIDQAGGGPAAEDVIQAGLVAGDAGVDQDVPVRWPPWR